MSELSLTNHLIRFITVLGIIYISFFTIIEQTAGVNIRINNKSPTSYLYPSEGQTSNKKRGLLDILYELRKKRNISTVVDSQMKNWLRWESKGANKSAEQRIIEIYKRNKEAEKIKQKNQLNKRQTIDHHKEETDPNLDETEKVLQSTTNPKVAVKAIPYVYKQAEFKALCNDPVFTAVDSSLDGQEILIFKGDKFYLMEEMRYGSGKLVASGLTKEILPGFDSKGFDSMITIKEGEMRGYTFGFYNNKNMIGWTPTGFTKVKHVNEFKKAPVPSLPNTGFDATIHNRDILNPLLIGFRNKTVYYYKIENKTLIKVKELHHTKSPEYFPPDVTSAFSMPNGYIYLFQNYRYCARELNFEMITKGVYCEIWNDNRIFLGCYGQDPPPFSIDTEEDVRNYNSLNKNEDSEFGNPENDKLCETIADIQYEKSLDGQIVLAFSRDKLWSVHNFLHKPNVMEAQLTEQKWIGFEANPDATLIVPEGKFLRGTLFEFKKGRYHSWGPDGKLLTRNKRVNSFKAIIHNSDINNPMAVAFNENKVYYYTTDAANLKLNKTVEYRDTEENWPKGITTGLTINTGRIYLFRGDKYCIREWSCSDKITNCCKKWMSAKDLFNCSKNK